MQSFFNLSYYVILTEDFNSRIGNIPDFYEKYIVNFIDQYEVNNIITLDNQGIPRYRNSTDDVVNVYGRKRIEFCKQ